MKNIKVAPSILSANAACLGIQVKELESSGMDFWHIDIMDGHFVPNLTIGPAVVKDLRAVATLPFEVHLMIDNPLSFVDKFVEAGADIITLHIETISTEDFLKEADKLHKIGKKICICLNPETPAESIRKVISVCDMVLVMTVRPGFGGQKFMPEVLPKISLIRSWFSGDLAVDGGIDDKSAKLCLEQGANVLACGSYIFKTQDKKAAIHKLKRLADSV